MSETLQAKTKPRRSEPAAKSKTEPSTKADSKPMRARARAIAEAGGSLEEALQRKSVPKMVDVTLSEALILGLLKQGVRK